MFMFSNIIVLVKFYNPYKVFMGKGSGPSPLERGWGEVFAGQASVSIY
jgi:hypothetical protein